MLPARAARSWASSAWITLLSCCICWLIRDRTAEQVLLRPEVVHDQAGVHPGGDGTDGRAVVARLGECLTRCGQDARLGVTSLARSFRRPLSGSALAANA
jgi:hypothetical protein